MMLRVVVRDDFNLATYAPNLCSRSVILDATHQLILIL